MPLLEVKRLQKEYITRTPEFCASIAQMALFAGQALGITGASGCGKSSLLEMLALLTRPTMAERFLIRTDNQTYDLAWMWAHAPESLSCIRRKHMGFVHQTGGLWPFLTVRDNIGMSLRLQGENATAISERVNELLDFLGLYHVAQALPETLSYGERQRTAVARALAHRPSLILADEPTSALDPESGQDVMRLLLHGAQLTGAALLVVSHDHNLLHEVGIPLAAMQPMAENRQKRIHYSLALPEAEILPDKADTCRPEHHQCLPPAIKKELGIPFFLAWRDFCHEFSLSLCAILAFAAAITPLIILGGLRNGVITILSQRLLNNPASLVINPYSSQCYTDADIEDIRALPNVDFIVPLTRTLASSVHIERKGCPPVVADVVPTETGDPLLQRYACVPTERGAVITQELARSLPDIKPGDSIILNITRHYQGQAEKVACVVQVQAILPDAADWKKHIYIHFPLLIAMENYRDGFAVYSYNWPGKEERVGQRTYAGFRMYVDSLEAVIPMRDELKRRGIDTYTFAREVEAIRNLKQALTLTTLLVGVVTLSGMAFSLASLAIASIRRKARFFAQGSLMGLNRKELLSLPLLQMSFIAVLAASCSLLFYTSGSALLDVAASPWLESGERACSLPVEQIVWIYTGALSLSCLCGVAACRQLLALHPAEVMRRDT